MSDRVLQPVNDANKSRQTMQQHQSVWLSHWKRIRCDAAGGTIRPNSSGYEELDYVARNDDDLTEGLKGFSRSVKEVNTIKMRTFENGDDIIKISSKSIGNERMLGSLFKDCQDTDDLQALKPEFAHNLELRKDVDCKSGIQFPPLISGISTAHRIPSQGCRSAVKGTSNNPPELMRTHSTRKDSIFGSNPLLKTSSHIVPYGFNIEKGTVDKGKAAVSAVYKQSRIAKRMLEDEECHEHRHSPDLVSERKMDCHSQPGNLVSVCLKDQESITCDHYLSTYGWGRLAKMQKSSGIRLFPSQCISSEESETKKSHNDRYYLLKLQNSVDDVEKMKICAALDAFKGIPEGSPRFSLTTNGLLITKNTDVKALKEDDMFRNTRIFAKINGDISSEFHCLLPFSGQGKQQLILQPLNSFIDIEVKKNIRDVKAFKVIIRNESSAQMDTRNTNTFKEENFKKNLHSGSNSTASDKAYNLVSNIPSWSTVASSREVGCGWLNDKLPHINLELPALPCAERTRGMEKLLVHVERPKPKSNFSLDDFPNADPGNRWVKRLKLSSSNHSAQGTKSSKFASSSSQANIRKHFGEIPKCSTTSSAPTLEKQHGKNSVLLDKSGDFSKKDGDRIMENPKDKGKALLLSHAWIKRWLYNERGEITKTKPETEVVCEPQSSKLSLEKLQKEQLPSIAAMALMGKALNCSQPCEFRKRGSFTVWNTKAF